MLERPVPVRFTRKRPYATLRSETAPKPQYTRGPDRHLQRFRAAAKVP